MSKNLLHLLVSGVLLGCMAGAVGVHALHVSGAEQISSDQMSTNTGLTVSETGFFSEVSDGRTNQSDLLTQVLSRLKAMEQANLDLTAQYEHVLDQLGETNRDLNELQFRVDSVGEGFRPLRVPAGGERVLGGGEPSSLVHPLLPLKGKRP